MVMASDGVSPDVSKNNTFNVAAAGAALPPQNLVDTVASPLTAGTTAGDGAYAPGSNATLMATPKPGYAFSNWTDDGVIVSSSAAYTFAVDVNHSLVAHFVAVTAAHTITTSATPAEGGTTSGGGTVDDGSSVSVIATPNAGYAFMNWLESGTAFSTSGTFTFTVSNTATNVLSGGRCSPQYRWGVFSPQYCSGTASRLTRRRL